MLRLYWMSGSPFAWRLHLVLEEKGLPYESVLLSVSKGDLKTPAHLTRSPRGKVPALEDDGGVSLYESTAIVEYLEERSPSPPLLPPAPMARALVRIEECECIEYLAPAFVPVARLAFFTPAAERDETALAAARAGVHAELEKFETRASARGGQFVVGGAFSRADCTWIPFVEIAGRGGVRLDPARTPWLVAWRDRMRARPAYDRSYPPHWRG
jgi:glutathione S-transferase/maleylpyruvate isomerase